jgi:hypothetical protein
LTAGKVFSHQKELGEEKRERKTTGRRNRGDFAGMLKFMGERNKHLMISLPLLGRSFLVNTTSSFIFTLLSQLTPFCHFSSFRLLSLPNSNQLPVHKFSGLITLVDKSKNLLRTVPERIWN